MIKSIENKNQTLSVHSLEALLWFIP